MKQCVSGWYIRNLNIFLVEVAKKVFQNKIFTREQHVHELTVRRPSTHFLDFCVF